MADKISENSGSLEERKQATKDLFERDIAPEVNRKDLESDNILGNDYHEVAQSDVAMPSKVIEDDNEVIENSGNFSQSDFDESLDVALTIDHSDAPSHDQGRQNSSESHTTDVAIESTDSTPPPNGLSPEQRAYTATTVPENQEQQNSETYIQGDISPIPLNIEAADISYQIPTSQSQEAGTTDDEMSTEAPTVVSHGDLVIARLVTRDETTGETYSYQLIGESNDLFEIIDNQLLIKDGVDFDVALHTSHSLVIQVTDSSGNTHQESVEIDIDNTTEEPVIRISTPVDETGPREEPNTPLVPETQTPPEGVTYALADNEVAPAGFILNEDGSYSFDSTHEAYQHLGLGETQTFNIPVTVTDETGATSTTEIQISVTGTNDLPLAEMVAFDSVSEGDPIIEGQVTATDIDDNSILTFALSDSSDSPPGFVINEDGHYSFDASSYSGLSAGEIQAIEIPISVTDEHGGTAETLLTITVTGTNNAPVAVATEVLTGQGELVTGQMEASDIDLADGQVLTFSTQAEVEGLILSEDGVYSFDPSSYEELGAGETETIEVPVTVTDDQGATAETTLTITVTGTNDGPVAEAQETSVDEGAVVKGQLDGGDVDLADGATLTFTTSEEVEGLVVNEDGSYSFDASGYEELGTGETETIEVPVTVTDDQGASSETTLTITVNGTNDLPTVTAVETSVDEGSVVKGQLDGSDVDLADGATLSFSTESEVEGLTLNEDGSYSFDASSYEELGAGETETIEVPVTVTDDQGATAETTLTITVTGTNDTPVAEAQETSIEEGAVVKGQLDGNDIDLADGSSLTFSTSSEVEGLIINEDGSYSFDASNYEELGAEQTETIEVPVTVTDDQGATAETTLTITVTGTNDTPVAEAQETSVEEGAVVKGQMGGSDVDLADGATLSFSTESEVEGLTLNEDGSYSFDASSYEELGAGETETIEVPVTVTDDQGATAETTLTITVTGTNDAPVAEAQETSVDEGSVVKGQLDGNDVDLADGATLTFTTSDEVEGLVVNEDGSYSFDASGYEELGVGETETIEVPVTVTDDQGASSETTLTITVNGTNDLPTVTAVETSVDEGSVVKGQLDGNDVDLADGATLSFSTESEVEGLTLSEDGSYSFDASSYEEIGAGESETIEIPVTVTDDQGASSETTLTITINGTNDLPTVTAAETSVDEEAVVKGQLDGNDVDLAEGSSLVFSTESDVDGLTINEDGSYSFDASGYETLGAGEAETIDVPVTVTDDQGATAESTLTITVTGTNDGPVAEAQETSVEEGAVVKGQLDGNDIDLADGSSLTFSTSSEVEGLILNEDGSYSFDASNYEELGAEQTETIEVPVTVTDDQGATAETTLTITVTGTNDAPVAEAQESSVEEGAVVKGQLDGNDVDLADGATLTFTTSEEVEGLVVNEDGSYSFDASSYEELGAGESETIEVPVAVTDDQGASSETTLTITVNGTNDLPTVTAAETSVDEEAVVKGQLDGNDVDLADGATLTFTASEEVEGLVVNEDGSYSFDASSYEELGAGETETIEVPVTVTDDQGATAETTLTITVTGTNDAPVAEAQETSVDEGSVAKGQLDGNDVDLADGATLSFSTESDVEGLTLNEDGSYSFDASSYEELGAGESETIEVPVTVTDDQGATAETTLTITVTGTNNAPVAEAQETSVEEGAVVIGQMDGSDVDLADGATLSFSTESEVEGLTLSEDGSYSFDASSYEELGAGETETIEVPVSVTDDQGGAAETTLAITVNGTNDLPTVTAAETSVDEGAVVKGQLDGGDVDLADGATLSFSTESDVEGLNLNEDGSYSFDASSYEELGAGETETIEVPVTVTDDQGATAETTLTITVTGTNDTPVAEAQESSVDEGELVTGQLETSDVDLAEGASLTFSTTSKVEGLIVNEDGSYSFDASSYEELGAGETETIEVPVTVTDDQGGTAETTLTLNIQGLDSDSEFVEEEREERDEDRGRDDREDREEHQGRGDREDREESQGRGDKEDREEHQGRGDREDREERQGRGDREDREERQGRGDREDREEHQGRGDREDREERQGRGDKEDREEHHGRGDRDDREENRGRGDREDREENRGRGDREDREENRGRGDREDREENRSRGDREDREENRGRGDRDDREENRGRGDREDREEHRGRGDREDREENRGRGDREDREEHQGRGEREDREENRSRGDREDREENRGRGDREDREEHRGRGEREDRDESHDRDERGDVSGETVEDPFDGADYFDEGGGDGWADVVQQGSDADSNADPSDPWAALEDSEQAQYEMADNALSVNPDTSGEAGLSDGSELTGDGVDGLEW
ncbi:MAG: VCBS domain-containing protein [Candidatus Thiodiazotropha sp. 6PLUC2]